ncbi:MAG: GAF domain-containing protein [Deltaproteobacteria bacterium]|nr:GAF domain-containing protein [Deltaproteobacteria bacterium]
MSEKSSLFINAFSFDKEDEEGIGSAASVPLLVDPDSKDGAKRIKGIVYIDSFKKSRPYFLEEDIQFLEKIARILGKAI